MVPPAPENKSVETILLDIYETLGGLEANVKSLLDDRDKASAGRTKIYEQIQGLERRLHDDVAELRTAIINVEKKVDPMVITVAEIKPVVKNHEQRHQQAKGALWMARVAWAIIGSLGTALAAIVAWLVKSGMIR